MLNAAVNLEKGFFKSFDATQIYYETYGQGEDPIIFIYGIACVMNHFRFQVDYFSRQNNRYKCILMDLRGHHKSEVALDPAQQNIAAVAQDIAYLMRTLGLTRAHLVGHSFGVPVLVAFSDLAPSMVKSLVLINGFLQNPLKGMFGLDVVEPAFDFLRRLNKSNPVLASSLWRTLIDNPFSAKIAGLIGGFNMKLSEYRDVEIYIKGLSQIPLNAINPMFADMVKFNGIPLAKKIKAPSLVISGGRDLITPIDFQKQVADSISAAQFLHLPYGSHCSQLDFSEYVNLKIDEFFQELSVSN